MLSVGGDIEANITVLMSKAPGVRVAGILDDAVASMSHSVLRCCETQARVCKGLLGTQKYARELPNTPKHSQKRSYLDRKSM